MKKIILLLLLTIPLKKGYSQCLETGENTGDTSCVSLTYLGQDTNYTIVRAADGNIWLQQNLGSNGVANSQDDEQAYGDLFQWGRWDDGHQLRNSQTSAILPTPNNPLGLGLGSELFYLADPEWWQNGASVTNSWESINPQTVTADNGCDPCKALGERWQLPSAEQWQAVIAAENITDISSAFQSNLKLTIAGARSTNGVYGNGVRGYYWSRTLSEDNANFAKYLYYSNFIVNPTAGGFREQGSSVRCIMAATTYCSPGVDFDVEPITAVTFNEIHNPSSEVINGTPAYENFTSQVTDVNRENIYILTVKGNTVNVEHDIRVFFDWNQDKEFDMNTEYYTASLPVSNGTDNVSVTFDIAIPHDAALGFTRMRIIKDMWNVYEEGEVDACMNAYYGQIEDYTINIQENLNIETHKQNIAKIHPNPTNGIILIDSQSPVKTYTLFNQLGLIITIGNSNSVNLSALSSGIYILKAEFENGSSTVEKIIKK